MEISENDITLNDNTNNITLTQDYKNVNIIDDGLSPNEMETVKNSDDQKQLENVNYKNDTDCNKPNETTETILQEVTNETEPVEKRYKTSSGNTFNNSTTGNDDVNVSNTEQNGQSCSGDVFNPTDSNVNNDEPSCSNQASSFKQKSKFKTRLYRKRSENNEDRDDESKKKARETTSNEDSGDDSNISHNSTAENNTRRHSSDQISESDDMDGILPIVMKVDDDSSEWSADNDDDDDDGRKTPQVLKNPIPKPNLFIVPELMRREFGYNRFLHRKFYGSLHAVQRLELMYKMEQHEGCVNAINFNEDGSLLASGSDDLKVVVWDWAVGRKRAVLDTGHSLNVFETKWLFNHNKDLIATCARDGHVRLLDTNTNEHRKLASHREEARRLAVHPNDPHTILSVGDDGKVFTIDIRDPKPTLLLKVQEKYRHISLYSIHINPRNSDEFCTGGCSRTVKIFDRRRALPSLKKFTPQNLKKNTTVYVTCAVYNYNGTEIIASYNDDDIYLFDTATPQLTTDYAHKYEGHRNNTTVKSVNFFGPKSEFIVSGSDCSNIFFWDKNTEAIVQWMPGDEQGVVNRLEPHPYVPILATSGLDSDVKIWVPSCEHEPKMIGVNECVKTNFKDRSDKLSYILNPFDSPSLPLFLRFISQYQTPSNRLNRISRSLAVERRLSQVDVFEVESDSSSVSRSSNNDSQSDSDESEGPQCTTS
ncbi:DDB1- and CUL4-associated factor 8 [Chelonus insularis]|uniref:DDB1- and CUL4-associated factor 8 n=1 Tax=Chelonus insularis TaxID=460826 RepID=UPI00158BF2C8|nr:DDB1- and CUL4-associated factor 8 [Chelonus insularis]